MIGVVLCNLKSIPHIPNNSSAYNSSTRKTNVAYIIQEAREYF